MLTQEFQNDLNKCSNIKQMFEVIGKHYKIEDCELRPITKASVTRGLITAIKMLNPKRR